MKKILSIILFVSFLYTSVGYYFIFTIRQSLIRNEVKMTIKNNSTEKALTVLSFNPCSKEYHAIEWMSNHEFRYKEKMYDIARKTVEADGTVRYYCVNDEQEEDLFADLGEDIKNYFSDKGINEKNSKPIKIETVKYIYLNSYCITACTESKGILFSNSISNYNSVITKVASPPPKQIIA